MRNSAGGGSSASRGGGPACAPQRFTDRLYRLKVDGSLLDPLCQFVTDKEFAKLYVEQALGPGWTPETYAVLRNAEDIAASASAAASACTPACSSALRMRSGDAAAMGSSRGRDAPAATIARPASRRPQGGSAAAPRTATSRGGTRGEGGESGLISRLGPTARAEGSA